MVGRRYGLRFGLRFGIRHAFTSNAVAITVAWIAGLSLVLTKLFAGNRRRVVNDPRRFLRATTRGQQEHEDNCQLKRSRC